MKKKKNVIKNLKKENADLREENCRLKTAVIQAENASKTKSTFLSHMSHDIRTPMNGVIGMTDIAVKNLDNQKKVLDCLQKIDDSSRHLVSLINDILDMRRIESGKMAINHEPMDMRNVVNSCVSITESLLAQRRIEFVKGFGIFKHPLLVGDELHLRQILINILGNAEKCSSQKGTGLGMAITRKLVDLMDGAIRVESEPGVGSRFIVEIAFDISIEKQRPTETPGESSALLNDMKVLLVEDNDLNAEIAKTIRALPRIDAATIPIIAMTADAYDEDIRKTAESGMDAHLIKPIDPEELLRTLRAIYIERR